jgi:hypothetical protein
VHLECLRKFGNGFRLSVVNEALKKLGNLNRLNILSSGEVNEAGTIVAPNGTIYPEDLKAQGIKATEFILAGGNDNSCLLQVVYSLICYNIGPERSRDITVILPIDAIYGKYDNAYQLAKYYYGLFSLPDFNKENLSAVRIIVNDHRLPEIKGSDPHKPLVSVKVMDSLLPMFIGLLAAAALLAAFAHPAALLALGLLGMAIEVGTPMKPIGRVSPISTSTPSTGDTLSFGLMGVP